MEKELFYRKMGKLILNRRIELGYSREYVANKSKVSEKFLYELEYGKKGCSVYKIKRICEALETKIDLLFMNI